nr:PDZ domain-containing protein [Candidatus Woesebacteria bacterium]
DQAGVQEDDIIVEFDGKKINGTDEESLTKAILKKKIGDEVKMKLFRNDEYIDTTVIIQGYSE